MSLYYISSDVLLLNEEKIWRLLTDCFWSKNIPIEYVARLIKYSLCFGVYKKDDNELVGFGRAISDCTTYAYICDVVIDPLHRKKGLGTKLIREIMAFPDLHGLKTCSLIATEEAKNIYLQNGFKKIRNSEAHLEINNLDIYTSADFHNLHKSKTTKLNA